MQHLYNNEFIQKDIFPIKIIETQGSITNADSLLKNKELQITTNEEDVTSLKNSTLQKNAYIVLDFGKEIHGRGRILTYTVEGETPARMRITYGESVSEAMSTPGIKGATNDHSIRDAQYLFPDYSDMSFNDSGFRFIKIELLSKNTEIKIKAVTAVSVMRDIPYLGSFHCSDDTINKIFETCAYTCHLNMQQYIWDGIKRDRLVWVGDMHPEMLTVKTVFGANEIIDKSLAFMRKNTPLPSWMNGMPTYSLWWLQILYDWYFYTGNEEFLEENKEYAIGLIKIVSKLVNEDGSDNLPSYFLDWPCNNKPQGISGSRALLALVLKTSSLLAEKFELPELKEKLTEKYKILVSSDINSYGAKQVTAFLGLSGWKDISLCGQEILADGCSGWSTFMSYYLLKSASCYDMNKTLSALRDYYGGMLNMGATTFWEDFDLSWTENCAPVDRLPVKGENDIHADFGAFCYKGLRHSLCHGWASGPTAFLIEEVLGIRVTEVGCKTVEIKPSLGSLEFAEGSFPTPYGNISVKCTKTDGDIKIEYSAPNEIKVVL